MRTSIQNRRLKKLIAFLEKLPRKQFNFRRELTEAKKNGHVCASVGCAIGWTPSVFPRTVKWCWNGDRNYDGTPCHVRFEIGELKQLAYRELAEQLFGIPMSHDIFQVRGQIAGLKKLGADATPKAVAKMLRKYMILVK